MHVECSLHIISMAVALETWTSTLLLKEMEKFIICVLHWKSRTRLAYAFCVYWTTNRLQHLFELMEFIIVVSKVIWHCTISHFLTVIRIGLFININELWGGVDTLTCNVQEYGNR